MHRRWRGQSSHKSQLKNTAILRSFIRSFIIVILGISFVSIPKVFSSSSKTSESHVTPEISENSVPGLIYSLESFLQFKAKESQRLEFEAAKNTKTAKDISNYQEVFLNPDFLSSLLFYSEKKFIQFAQSGECHFLALLENNLLKIGDSAPENYIIDLIDTKDQTKANLETALISKNDYIDLIYKRKCINNKDIGAFLGLQNIATNINKFNLPLPKNKNECLSILNQWQQNLYTPYFCRMNEVFQAAKKSQYYLSQPNINDLLSKRKYSSLIKLSANIKSKMTSFQSHYIENLCQNLFSPEFFCIKYLSDSFWNKIINGERSPDYMKYRCQLLFKKTFLAKDDFEKCKQILESTPTQCQYLGASTYTSLVPKPRCDSVSKALNFSKLKNFYQDCPSNIGNEGLTNVNRIISHLENKVINSDSKNCSSLAAASFAKLITDYGHEELWNFKACYYDILEEREICYPIILGSDDTSNLSETKIIEQILAKILKSNEQISCKILSDKEYRPQLLKYKRGCFLVYKSDQCTSMNCPKKIILNDQEMRKIRYFTGTNFNYFPSNFKEEQYSMSAIMKKIYKLESSSIKNLTQLKALLSQKNSTIIHGMGCAENLHPNFFKKITMNQCRPIPFIIDGHFQEDSNEYLVIRSSIDDNQSPRITTWNIVYNAVKTNQELHNLKSWNLYAIKPQAEK